VKVLLDACVWGGAARDLSDSGHDVVWAGSWTEDPGDEEILRRAHADGRVLATLDKDFGEIAIVRGVAHSGIVRLVEIRARDQGPRLAEVLARYGDELQAGAIVTVEWGRVRVRPAR
jgi:predicted nuclease of predicted toxin-antitoxin system